MSDLNTTDSQYSPWSLSDDGRRIILKPTSEIYAQYETLFSEIFPGLNLDPSTPQGQIISGLTESDTRTLQLIEDLVNVTMFGGSNEYLDKWSFNFFRVLRKQGSPSTVTVTVYGTPKVVILKGFTVSDGELKYKTDRDYEIPASGEVDVLAICTEISEKVSLTNKVNLIVTPQVGISRCLNKAPSTSPVLIESDSSLYQRALRFGSISSNATLNSILAEIAQLEGVIKVSGHENYEVSQKTFKGTIFERNSFGVVVLGGDDTEIAKVIQKLKPPGPTMMGNQSVTIPVPYENYKDNKEYNVTYKFYRPTSLAIKFSVTCKLLNNSPLNYKDIVTNAIKDYIQESLIGGVLNIAELTYKIVDYSENRFLIEDVQFAKKSEPLADTDIDLQFLELAVIEDDADIIVTGN